MSKVPDTKKPADNSGDKEAGKPAQKAATKSDAKTDVKPAAKTAAAKAASKDATKTDPKKPDGATKSTDQKKPTTPPKTKKSGSPFLSGFGIAAVLVIAVVIGGIMTLRDWYPAVEPYVGDYIAEFLPESDDEGEDRLAALEARLTAMEQSGDAAAIADLDAARVELTSQIGDIMARLERAERAVTSLRSTASTITSGSGSSGADVDVFSGRLSDVESANAASRAALEELTQRIEALSQRQTGASAAAVQTQAVVLVIGQVRRAVAAGEAFADPLRTLSATAGNDSTIQSAIDVMQPHAATGVLTLAALRRAFSDDASAIVRAGDALAETDWIAAAMNKVSSLVTVRRVDGEGDPASVDAIVAAAEGRLAAGDLDGAVAVIDTLESGAASAASAWLSDARARLAVDDALTKLHDLAVGRLSSAAAGEG